MDIRAHNSKAWDREVELENPWTVPIGPEAIAAARQGEWKIFLTPTKPVPNAWFPDLKGRDVLCLASGGGQQGPILAAVGARVTVLDNSPRQLQQDRLVAEQEGLVITTVQDDMADLSAFPNESFDIIVHPVSNCFVPSVRPVWAEAFRILRHRGTLLAGLNNPVVYIFDLELAEHGQLQVKNALPYSDMTSLTEEERQRIVEKGEPFEFGHTLEDQIGGQLDIGFLLAGFYEDDSPSDAIADYMPTFIATRALTP